MEGGKAAAGRHQAKKSARRQRAECRAGRHALGPPQPIGGGIVRQTCEACGAVTIDLREAEPVAPGLFVAERRSESKLGEALPRPRRRR